MDGLLAGILIAMFKVNGSTCFPLQFAGIGPPRNRLSESGVSFPVPYLSLRHDTPNVFLGGVEILLTVITCMVWRKKENVLEPLI